eukprot:CAMPEP_0197864876 /NCGR_PEP_ID=MMETSP1438-20131217/43340_1 /TAXON_ID=1461541 /ORGANISM="Pterosperma sp., Strain CCMP1384" /LENGTH=116 /DNA_ID=CAMNT_0043483251 /DNA_START=145 /DNA_END=495 /DNA_ORIENTATION=+
MAEVFYNNACYLDVAWVKHAADLAADGLRGKILAELSPDHTAVSVRAGHLAPDAPVLAALLQGLCLVDVCKPLALVEGNILLGVDVLELDQRGVLILVGPCPLVSQDEAPDVQPDV